MINSRLKTFIFLGALAALTVGAWLFMLARPPVATPTPGRIQLDNIRVTFRPGTSVTDRDAVIQKIGGHLYLFDEGSRTAQIRVHPRSNEHEILKLIVELEKFPVVEYAAPEVPVKYD